MIYGIGTDIVSVARMQRGMDTHGERFARRILTDEEFGEFQASVKPAHFLAKRFAAKEAVVKALGLGFRDGISLKHIGVTHDHYGKPMIACSGRILELMEELQVGQGHISLADEHEYAVAFVTFMTR